MLTAGCPGPLPLKGTTVIVKLLSRSERCSMEKYSMVVSLANDIVSFSRLVMLVIVVL